MTKEMSSITEQNNEKVSLFNSSEMSVPSINPPTEKSSEEIDGSDVSLRDSDSVPVPFIEEESASTEGFNRNKRINGLWSINENKNAFAHVSGVGWRKIANNSDSGIVALNMLTSHARAENSAVDYSEDKDSMIYEIYVW